MQSKYIPIIGLEVHVELKTATKMFCSCSADYFGKAPNTHTCPVCLGLPGALPVPNNKAIEWCIKIALALNCEINNFSKFDRKNYFYPDLSKGYQISQYDLPFGSNGYVTLKNGTKIRIRRVHMEEDTGKLSHQEVNGTKVSLIDFNRSGVPLVEIVTEPDFHNATDVKEYLQSLQQIVRYLNVSNADMEKGDMRLEPNISLTTNEKKLPNYKVEVKNINSFRFVEKAITYELKRQEQLLSSGEIPAQETRGWNENKGITFSQRIKEEAKDYRYFPEPDIPPIITTDEQISRLENEVPELPGEKTMRFIREFGITVYDAEILTRDAEISDYFENVIKAGKSRHVDSKQIANTIINKKLSLSLTPDEFIDQLLAQSKKAEIDEYTLEQIFGSVISENEKAVTDYKNGKETVIMFLVGQVLRKLPEKPDVNVIKQNLIERLKQ